MEGTKGVTFYFNNYVSRNTLLHSERVTRIENHTKGIRRNSTYANLFLRTICTIFSSPFTFNDQ